MPYDDLIDKHANRVGIDPAWMRKIMQIESSGNPNNKTGSYKGLFQLSDREFRRHGGSGDIYDPEQNTMAAANKLAQDKLALKQKLGRDPTLGEVYMIHQQGEAGAAAHAANPDGVAWQNIRKYYSSDEMAKKAIWGNVPDKMKAQFGSVDNVTSGQFTGMWNDRIEGTGTTQGHMWARGIKPTQEPKDYEGRADTEKKPKDELGPIYKPDVSPPEINIPPTLIGSMSAPAQAPQIAGATRWERG